MNTKRSVTWGLLAGAAACAAMAAMPGCELLVDFDRSKIPTDGRVARRRRRRDARRAGIGRWPGRGEHHGDRRRPDATAPDARRSTADGRGDGGDGSRDTGAGHGHPRHGRRRAERGRHRRSDSGPDAVVDAALDAE